MIAAIGLAGCGSTGNPSLASTDNQAEAGSGFGTASEAGIPQRDASSSFGDGGSSCGSPLDMKGCACTPGTTPRACYPGPHLAKAGVGP